MMKKMTKACRRIYNIADGIVTAAERGRGRSAKRDLRYAREARNAAASGACGEAARILRTSFGNIGIPNID